MKGILYSTVAIHRHAQEMARALEENGNLRLWHTGWLHAPESSFFAKRLESLAGTHPLLSKSLARRRLAYPSRVPLRMRRAGEMGEILCGKLLKKRLWADRIWEWQEKSLAKEAAQFLKSGKFSAYLGLEHGTLEAIKACKDLGIRTCLVFTSPHHAFRKKWVEDLAREHGIPISDEEDELLRRGVERDQRRDEEMEFADLIRTNSTLVSQTLIAGGANPKRVVSVPLGADIHGIQPLRPRKNGEAIRFIVSGPVSLRKGAYFVLQAWKKLRPKGATLHFYGSIQMEMRDEDKRLMGVTFYGNRPQAEVQEAYRNAHVLIFPTLCDGFGMVVPEAMVAGCAVITTRNAGAADWIEEEKNGWKVEAGSVTAMMEVIQKALDAGLKLEEMRKAAQATAKQNSWGDFRDRFVQTLTEQRFINPPS